MIWYRGFSIARISQRLSRSFGSAVSLSSTSQRLPIPVTLPTATCRISPFLEPPTTVKNVALPSVLRPFVPNVAILDLPSILQTPKVDPATNVTRKEAAVLVQIRKRKMKKHKLRKLRKRMKFLWAKRRLRREKAKEAVFKAELLAQLREAESFDAGEYVASVLNRIRNRKRPLTPEERREIFLDLVRQHRSNVQFIKPKFD